MTLSRRAFLRVFGITAGGITLAGVPVPFAALPDVAVVQGRMLYAVTLNTASRQAITLPPDSIVQIQGIDGDHYRTPYGVLSRAAVQPMQPALPFDTTTSDRTPFVAEVIAPAASIRAYASAHAPLITRVGHGGTLTIHDVLHHADTGWWYETAHGWTQAIHWRALHLPLRPTGSQQITIDRQTFTLTAYQAGQPVLQTEVALPSNVTSGTYDCWRTTLADAPLDHDNTHIRGIPYRLSTAIPNVPHLHGAYWHNTFGKPHNTPHIELSVLAAKWLYAWAGDQLLIKVI